LAPAFGHAQSAPPSPAEEAKSLREFMLANYTKHEYQIPMRDGVKLETIIFSPKDAEKPLPFLLMRTPYGIPAEEAPLANSKDLAHLIADGYIWVIQSIRGRFKSEGSFVMMRPPRDKSDPRGVDETTDAFDTIEWLLKNVPSNNGRAGMLGTSYDGWTSVMALLDPHPALKAVAPGASPADMFIGDDFHHNGAFRLAYSFEFVAFLESAKETNTEFPFDRGDTFDWYLDIGPLSNVDKRYFHGKMPTWVNFVEHPNRDAFWEQRAVPTHLSKTTVPTMHVAGWWDQEDFYGPVKIYETLEAKDDKRLNYFVAGPWNHGGWHGPGRTLGPLDFGSDTGDHFQSKMQAPFFARYLHDKSAPDRPEAEVFETGTNRWRSFDRWPPEAGVTKKRLYFRPGRALSFDPPSEAGNAAADSYISDPASPVPYHPRPIVPFYEGEQWQVWMLQDQRFVDRRPDVLTYSTGALDKDVTVAGDIVAELFAATSGTDSDWVVKLIDVFPEGEKPAPPNEKAGAAGEVKGRDMRGYQLIVASEVLRGRFRESFARPSPIPANQVVKYTIDLHTNSHVFLKGHKIMVQVQSTWFPMIDRNPQKYVENIFKATEADFIKATQRVSRSREAASAIVLPILSP
ncbi:MAG TPA: CocE/NonD family hydrolase, partial [Polyangiaceae bacterium]|nr:CocE/NonD family hydrolase [Polyangiaceae bacterium]